MTMPLEPWLEPSRRESRADGKSRAKEPGLVRRRPHVLRQLLVAHAIPRLHIGQSSSGVVHIDDAIPVAERFGCHACERHERCCRVLSLAWMLFAFPPRVGVEGGWWISGWKIAPARRECANNRRTR